MAGQTHDHGRAVAGARLRDDVPAVHSCDATTDGQSDATTADLVAASLGDVLAVILDDGPVRGGTPSTVVDCSSFAGGVPRILREGAISATDIANALG